MRTFVETFVSCNILTLKVQSTGLGGGDAGHGGMAIVELRDDASTCWEAIVRKDEGVVITKQPSMIAIKVQGDTEMKTLADALEAAARFLRQELNYHR